MKYKYLARTKKGELQTGIVEASSRDAALNILTSHELYVLSVEGGEKATLGSKVGQFFGRVKAKDLMIFTRQFATLLAAKVPLNDGLKNLYRQTKNPILKEAIFEMISDIDAGLSLSQALQKHAAIFSDFYVNIMRSAEVTGRMEESTAFLADYLEKQTAMISKVRSALIYPVFVVVVFFLVATILITFVLPQLRPIFEESGAKLPLLTQILVSAGDFALEWWWAIAVILLLFGFLLVDYFRTDEGKAVLDELKVHAPVLGDFFRKFYVARFAQGVSILIKSGIPITQAIEISGHTIGNIVYRDTLHEATEGVRGGELLSQTLERSEYFPPLVSQMIAIGESTGRLEELLEKVSTFYTREVDDATGNLVELIQPILMLVIGVFVGLLFAAILLPIYNLAQTF